MKLSRADSIKALEISKKHGITIDEMKKIISAPYSFMRMKLKDLEIEEELTKEEFDELKTNFNVPCLFKFYASYSVYKKINKLKNKNKKKK